jgi:hypothetical protein
MVTLCPAGSTQPVAASGEVALGAAATQMVCDIRLVKVTRRLDPAAPEGGGSEAAGAGEEGAAEVGLAEGIRASVGATERGLADGVRDAAVVPPAPAAAAAVDGRWPPADAAGPVLFAPSAAQPAVSVMTPSSTAVVVARDNRARRRLPFRPTITSVLPAWIGFRTGDGGRGGQITHFVFRIFRYRAVPVVSPSCDADPLGARTGRSDRDRRAAR